MRYIWHINGILAAVALGVLYFGLTGIPKALITGSDTTGTVSSSMNGKNGSLTDNNGDTAMVEAARLFTRRFGPPIGTVNILIEPQNAITQGAQWKINTSPFLNSGQLAQSVAAGNHVIGFKEIEGYHAPKPFKITVGREQTVKEIGKYILIPPPEYGKLRITLGPEGIAGKGGKWKVDKGEWQESGATSEKILVGSHQVTFAGVADYDPPAAMSVTIEKDQTVDQTADYKRIDYGSVLVNLSPEDAVKAGVKWRVKGNSTWYQSGETDIKARAGTQTIEFQGTQRWKAPAAIAVDVVKDELFTTEAVFEWIILKQGSIIVKIMPNDSTLTMAQWQLNGKGDWYNSDEKVGPIDEGKYSINFKPVAGWNPPDAMNVEVVIDQISDLEALYRKPKPAPPAFTLTATIVLPPKGGIVWVKLPKATRDHVFLIGEMIDTDYKLIEVRHGIAVVNRGGYDFTLTIPKPSPPKLAPPKSTTTEKPMIPSRRPPIQKSPIPRKPSIKK